MTAVHESTPLRSSPVPTWRRCLRRRTCSSRSSGGHSTIPIGPLAATRVDSGFVDVTAGDFYARVRAVAKGLIASGVEAGDRVALMSHTRLEWMLLDYAILAAGAVTVPIYETSSTEQVEWILSDSGACLVVVETPMMRATYDEVHAHATACREALVIDDGGLDELVDAVPRSTTGRSTPAWRPSPSTSSPPSSTRPARPGAQGVHADAPQPAHQRSRTCRPCARCSPTTRRRCCSSSPTPWPRPSPSSASNGASWPSHRHGARGRGAPLARPTLVVSVPRVFEKVFNKAQHKARPRPRPDLRPGEQVAIRWSEDATQGRRRLLTSAEHALFGPLVYRKVHDVFGDRLRFAVSGGGPLGERLTHFFNGIGVRVFEGWAGLTETSPTLTLNSADAWRPGTVGRPGGDHDPHRGRRRDPGQGPAGVPGLLERRGGDRRGVRRTAGSAPATSASSTPTATCGSRAQEGADRHRRGKNVAPAPLEDRLRAPADQPGGRGRRPAPVRGRHARRRRGGARGVGGEQGPPARAAGPADPRHAARRAAGRSTRPTARCPRRSPSARSSSCPAPVHRLGRAHAHPEGALMVVARPTARSSRRCMG